MCEDERDNVKVIPNPEMKIVCTININIEIEILNEGYKWKKVKNDWICYVICESCTIANENRHYIF